MGRGQPMMGGAANAGQNIPTGPGGVAPPRGPRAAMGGGQQQTGPQGQTGPMRSHGQRGQSAYHPYGRG